MPNPLYFRRMMLHLGRVIVALVLLACLVPGQNPVLRAGVAAVDITPSTLEPMYGYGNRRCGPAATDTHDRLHAKVLYLEAGADRMAIVTMDLGSMESKSLFARVADELKIPLLLLSPSHTHSAPQFLGRPGGDESPSSYRAELEEKIYTAVKRAAGSTFPARLSVGRGAMQLGYNRLLLREDGRARAVFDNLERIPYGPVDPEFLLLQVSDLEGRPKALAIHYAVHPVVLGPTSCLYSADYPGVTQARVEAAMPGVQTMFVQGAAGSTNPLFQGRTGDNEKDFATMTKMGELLADAVIQSAKQLRPIEDRPASIAHRTQAMSFQNRWETGKTLTLGLSTILINEQIAIATVPGEPFLAMQSRWKQEADAPYVFFYGYTQSTPDPWPGYIPDMRSAALGGYGADVGTAIEVGAAERIMDQHLKQLYDLKGVWRNEPGKP